MKKVSFFLLLLTAHVYGLENHHVFDRLLQSFSSDQEKVEQHADHREKKLDGMHNPWLQRKQLFTLYSSLLPFYKGILSLQSIDDLQLYCGAINHPKLSLFNRIDKTVTTFGQGCLAHKLANPITDITELQERQGRIRRFEHELLPTSQVDIALQRIGLIEPTIYGYWKDADKEMQESIDALYFAWLPDFLNNSEINLEIRTRFFQSLAIVHLFGNAVACSLPDLYAKLCSDSSMSYVQIIKNACAFQLNTLLGACRLSKVKQGVWAWKNMYQPGEEHLDHILRNPAMRGGQLLGLLQLDKDSDPISAKAVSLFEFPLTLTLNAINLYGWQKTISAVVGKSNFLLMVHQKVHGFAKFCQQVQELHNLVGDDYPFPAMSSELYELYTLLNTSTFNYPSRFAGVGRVLKAYRLISKHKDEFAKLFEWIGEIDTDMSMAKLIKKHKDTSSAFMYVSYDDSDKGAYLSAQSFWNPFIDPSAVVTNSIELGSSASNRNVVLTGSNAGGKSTLMKALLFNIMLSQTFGIAAARGFKIKPFGRIYSSMQLIDDLADGKSHFAAEIDRAKDIIATSRDGSNAPVFLVIDELFTGTASDKGRRLAERMLKRLFGTEYCMTICATHFNELTDLTETCNCVNMRLASPSKDENGKLVYPYVLESGISTINVAEDMFDEMIDW